MTLAADVRGALQTALSGVSASVYPEVPEVFYPPVVCFFADSPYLTPNLINKSTVKLQVNLVISVAVANNENAGALDNLEQLTIAVLAALPNNYEVGNIEAPYQATISGHNLLVADMRVTTYYTQGA